MPVELRPSIRGVSAYTVFGFIGHAVGTLVAAVLAWWLGASVVERLVIVFVPPLVFLGVVRWSTKRAGYERIVFYESAIACTTVAAALAVITGQRVGLVTDVTVIGISTFLAFGRIGCFHVACCHGRPARFGIRYGRAHVARGLSPRLEGRPLVPVQIFEAVVSALLAALGIAITVVRADGSAAATIAAVYGVTRFGFELVRGDPDRKLVWHLSEAQRMAILTAIAAAALRPTSITLTCAAIVVAAGLVRFAMRRRPAATLLLPAHLDEIFATQRSLGVGDTVTTRSELAISKHVLPDGRLAYVWSRGELPLDIAKRMAVGVDPTATVVPGRTPGLVHVIAAPKPALQGP